MPKKFAIPMLFFSMICAQTIAPESMLAISYAQDQATDEDGHGDETQKGKISEASTTLPISTINFSVIKKGRVRGTVSIVPILVVENPTDAELSELKVLLPLIRSDLTSVANLLAEKRFRINKPIDPDFVVAHFQRRIDLRIGKDRLKVYIQDAVIRPIR